MPLESLLGLVVGGIAGIAILLHLLGHSNALRFATAAEATAHWQRHAPDHPARRVHLSSDGRAALVETDQGLGLLWAMGADSTGHVLTDATLRDTKTGLRIALHDFAAPAVQVRLTPEDRQTWRRIIETPEKVLEAIAR